MRYGRKFLHMQKLAGIITESEYAVKLEELKQDESFINSLKNLEDLSLKYVTKYGKIKIDNFIDLKEVFEKKLPSGRIKGLQSSI
jgi:hypothetical protein